MVRILISQQDLHTPNIRQINLSATMYTRSTPNHPHQQSLEYLLDIFIHAWLFQVFQSSIHIVTPQLLELVDLLSGDLQ
jgi:hypothetical protein